MVDITAQRRAEARERHLLAEAAGANARFRAFFEQGDLFAGIMDVDGTLVETNRLAWEACGYTAEQVRGLKFWDGPWWAPSPELRERIRDYSRRAAAGEAIRAEMPYYVASGEERMVDFRLTPIRGAEDRIAFLAPTGTDITERKRMEADRERLEEELRALASNLSETDRRKDEFLATLAHELRNPLAPLRTASRSYGSRTATRSPSTAPAA